MYLWPVFLRTLMKALRLDTSQYFDGLALSFPATHGRGAVWVKVAHCCVPSPPSLSGFDCTDRHSTFQECAEFSYLHLLHKNKSWKRSQTVAQVYVTRAFLVLCWKGFCWSPVVVTWSPCEADWRQLGRVGGFSLTTGDSSFWNLHFGPQPEVLPCPHQRVRVAAYRCIGSVCTPKDAGLVRTQVVQSVCSLDLPLPSTRSLVSVTS